MEVHPVYDPAVDVGALLMHGRENAAGVAVEAEVTAVVADLVDHAAADVLEVDIGLALDFSGHDHLACGDESFACYFRLWVAGDKFVEDGVGDLS